jgi:putative transposase
MGVLAAQLKSVTGWPVNQCGKVLRIFQPETVFKWHRELVRRKWTYRSSIQRGRPRTNQDVERLIVRLARENLDWGNVKIADELAF